MWEVISQNPKFQEAFGGYMTEELYNQMPQDAKDNIARVYGSVGTPSPVLDIKPMEISPATNPSNQNPVLNTQPNPYFPPNQEAPAAAPVPTGYEDYSVQDFINAGNTLNTNPVLSGDMNRGVEPVAPIMQDPQRSDAYLGTLSKEKLRELADAGNVQAAALLQANIPDPVAPPVVDPAQPAAPVLAPNVTDVDYSDPTLAPMPQPVLVDTTQPKTETTTTESDPVLKSGGQGRSTGALSAGSITSSSGPKTSNARGSQMPQMLVDRNEALIRIGGAMYSGALKGDGIGAATTEYGRIQDANREQARKMAEAEQKRQMEMAKLRAKGAGGGKGSKKDGELLTATNAAMSNYQDALTAIRDSRAAGGNLTGIGGIAKSLVDNFTGDEDAARRLILKRVKVDDALLRVAETKGAISNAEMKLFLDPAPKDWQDEAIWEQWIIDRMEALQRVQQRLSQGGTVPVNQRPTGSTASGLSDDDLAYINN
jgi:hypothetical protein